MSIKTDADKPEPAKSNPREAWLNCTEDLIFAAAYYGDQACRDIGWMRALDKRCVPYNSQDESRKCQDVYQAINNLSPHLNTQLERAHAANEHPTFRLQRMGQWPTEDALTLARSSGRRYVDPQRTPEQIAAARARCDAIMARMA